MASTWRATAKADRRQRYLDAAAELFAVRGYAGVGVEELGAAAGVSGPALYRHFRGKEDVLAELLVTASERLLGGARQALARGADPRATLADLVAFHADFALAERDVIRVQDRELAHLPEEAPLRRGVGRRARRGATRPAPRRGGRAAARRVRPAERHPHHAGARGHGRSGRPALGDGARRPSRARQP